MPDSIRSSIRQTWRNVKHFVEQNERSVPDDTVKSSFQRDQNVSRWYTIYRWSQFFVHLVIYFGSFFDIRRSWTPTYTAPATVYRGVKFYFKWFLYLTHWGVFLNMLQSLLGAAIVTQAFKNRYHRTPNSVFGVPLKLATFYRYLFCVALNLSVYITVGFWMLIYSPEYHILDLVTVAQHGLCTVALLLDMFVVKFPYKLVTAFWTCAVGIAYEHLLVGHYLIGGLDRYEDRPYLYEVQDWSHPIGSSIAILCAVITIVSFDFLLWGLYLVKRHFIGVYHTNSY